MDYNNTHNNEINKHNSNQEYATDFVVETERNNVNEFTPAPEEYVYNPESNAESENAATLDDGYSFDGTYGKTSDMYEIETSEDYDMPYNTETADEFDEEYEAYDENNKSNIAYSSSSTHSPSDETAATIDEWYTTDKPSARERCQLDDYEIISDVLGSEKQIVKLYSTALCEASEEPFRNIIKENLDEAAADQYKAFEFMQKRGMYPTEQATEENITKAKQQFTPLCRNNCGCTKSNND